MIREFLRYLSLELYRSPNTVEAYAADLRGFNDFIKESGVTLDDAGFFLPSAVSSADIREWTVQLAERGVSPISIRRKIQSLRAFYTYLVKTGKATVNPAAAVVLPKRASRLPEIATPADVEEAIGDEFTTRNRLILELLYGCGLRRAELVSVTDADVNLHSAELRITGKGSKTRLLPLPESLALLIADWQRERDALYPDLAEPRPLIATRHGAMSVSMLYKIVHKALLATSASKKSPHTLRHTFATSLLNGGADINSVKDLLGHSSLAATQIYTHVAFADLSREYRGAHPRSPKKGK